MSNRKRQDDEPDHDMPIEKLIGTPDEDDGDPAEKIEDEGEPFDGNFA